MKRLVLYNTAGCHLCDLAKACIEPWLSQDNFSLIETDIANNDILMERYAVKIPVIFRPDNGDELCWPFDKKQLERFLM